MGEGNADLHFLEAYRRVEIFLRGVYGGKGGDGRSDAAVRARILPHTLSHSYR